MKREIAYMTLYLISLVYTVKRSEELRGKPYNFFSDDMYILACAIMSLFLVGIFIIIDDFIKWIKIWITVFSVQFIVWRIKRKYKIK